MPNAVICGRGAVAGVIVPILSSLSKEEKSVRERKALYTFTSMKSRLFCCIPSLAHVADADTHPHKIIEKFILSFSSLSLSASTFLKYTFMRQMGRSQSPCMCRSGSMLTAAFSFLILFNVHVHFTIVFYFLSVWFVCVCARRGKRRNKNVGKFSQSFVRVLAFHVAAHTRFTLCSAHTYVQTYLTLYFAPFFSLSLTFLLVSSSKRIVPMRARSPTRLLLMFCLLDLPLINVRFNVKLTGVMCHNRCMVIATEHKYEDNDETRDIQPSLTPTPHTHTHATK